MLLSLDVTINATRILQTSSERYYGCPGADIDCAIEHSPLNQIQ
jgi:hypothetical protein